MLPVVWHANDFTKPDLDRIVDAVHDMRRRLHSGGITSELRLNRGHYCLKFTLVEPGSLPYLTGLAARLNETLGQAVRNTDILDDIVSGMSGLDSSLTDL